MSSSSSSSDDDDDDVPLGQLRNNKRATKVIEPTTVSSSSSSSSSSGGGGRSTGSRKRPNYREEDSDHDEVDDDDGDFASSSSSPPPPAKKKKKNNKTTPKVKIVAKEEKAAKIAVKREEEDVKSPASTKNGGASKKEKKKKSDDKKKVDKKSASSSSKKKKAGGAGAGTASVLKAMEKSERISHGMQAHLWWDAPNPPGGCQWSQMEHAGVSFPDPYVPHGVPLSYDGVEVRLTPSEEEAATFFAAMDPDGMHLGNARTAPTFVRNFMTDFRAILGKDHAFVRDFDKCDFGRVRRHLEEQKMVKRAITDGERKTNKGAKDAAMFRFGYALVDGHLEKVGNYNSE